MQRIFPPILLFFLLLNPLLNIAHDHDNKGRGDAIKFTENKNQWEKQVLYKADIPGGALFLENNGFTYNFFDVAAMNSLLGHGHNNGTLTVRNNKISFHAFKVKFKNANPVPKVSGSQSSAAYSNYFLGNDKSKWASHAYSFEKIVYENLYNNINLELYTNENYLKYDFIVKPGGKTGNIILAYEGVDNISINRGNLVIKTSVNEIIEQKPYAYQVINGEKKEVACSFVLKGKEVSFSFPEGFDKSAELVIDPTLMFSTYSGSFANNFGYTATFDSKGFLYSGSSAFGTGYPTTIGAYDVTFNGGIVDIAITKYDTTGQSLIYSTYIGGSSDELPHSLIVNSVDELFIFGTTSSTNYPTTPGAYDVLFNGGTPLNLTNGLGVNYTNGSDIIISRLSANGANMLASTYVGGTANDGLNSTPGNQLKYNYADEVRGEIIIDANNNIYVTSCTRSSDFPVTPSSFQPAFGGGTLDGCIVKMDNNLTTLIWGSYLGGTDDDAIYASELDNNNNLYVTGGTRSTNFPTTPGVLYPVFMGGLADGFVTHITESGQNIISSTYFGSIAYDQSYFVELDKQNNVYIFGQTQAASNTFIQNALYNSPNSGQFITKMNPTLDIVIWSTRFGTGSGVPNISPTAFLVDVCDKIYLSGWGGAVNGFGGTSGMDITGNAFQSTTDNSDFYLMVMEDDASSLFYGSFFGSPNSSEHVDGGTSRFDRKGRIYQSVCAGCGGDNNFPTTPGAWSPVNNNSCNNGVFKFDFNLPITIADFDPPPVNCAPYTITFNNTSSGSPTTNFIWDFGDGNGSTSYNPTHTYATSGTYYISLISNDTAACNLSDTIVKQIVILADTTYSLAPEYICNNGSQQIGLLPSPGTGITYSWSPVTGLNATNVSNPIASPTTTTNYTLLISNGVCTDTVFQTVNVVNGLLTSQDTTLCNSATTIFASSNGSLSNYIWSSNSSYTDTLNTAITDSTLSVNPATSTTYFVISYNQYCSFTDSVVINVLADSTYSIPPLNICSNDSVQIGIDPFIDPNVSYSWSPSTGLSATNVANPIASPPGTVNYMLLVTNGLCTDTIFQTVSITSNMITSSDTTLCGSSGAILFASGDGGFSNYIWSSTSGFNDTLNTSVNDSTLSVNPIVTTTYYVIGYNQFCAFTDSVTVNILFDSVYSAPPIIICSGDSVQIGINALTDQSITYNWSPTNGLSDSTISNPVASPSDSTIYMLVVSNGVCSDTIYQTVNVFSFNMISSNDTAFCNSINLNLFAATGGAAQSYTWSSNSNFTDTLNTSPTDSTLFVNAAGTYYIMSTGQGCSIMDSVIVTVSSLNISTQNSWICNGDTTFLQAINPNPSDSISYSWSPIGSIISGSNTSNPVVAPTGTTAYTVTATNFFGCQVTSTTTVSVYGTPYSSINAFADMDTINMGSSTLIHVVPGQGFNYTWTPVTGLNNPSISDPTATPASTTTYTVTISDNNCSYLDSVTVYVFEFVCDEPNIFIPTAFTPNDDKHNDLVLVRGNYIEELYFVIYNRWGEKIFETTDQAIGWDGTYKGMKADPGVFVYYLTALCVDKQEYFKKGNITLIR